MHKRDGATSVYTRYVEDYQLKAFKISTVLKAPLASVMAIIGDVEGAPKWMHLCRTLDMVSQPNVKGEFVSYMVTNSPWPVKDRDVYIQNSFFQDPETFEIIMSGKPAEGFDQIKNRVRIPDMYHQWRITPLDYNTTRLELIGHGNPGGWIPKWIANWVATGMPEETFRNIEQMIQLDKYKVDQAEQIVGTFNFNVSFPQQNFALN